MILLGPSHDILQHASHTAEDITLTKAFAVKNYKTRLQQLHENSQNIGCQLNAFDKTPIFHFP